MKSYHVYASGNYMGILKARSQNDVEQKARSKYPNEPISVEYTER